MLFKSNFTIYIFVYTGECRDKNYKKRYNAEKKRSEGLENQLREKQGKIAYYQKELADKMKIIDDKNMELQIIREKIKRLFDTTRDETAVTGQNIQHNDDNRNTATTSQPPAPRKTILISPPKKSHKVRSF